MWTDVLRDFHPEVVSPIEQKEVFVTGTSKSHLNLRYTRRYTKNSKWATQSLNYLIQFRDLLNGAEDWNRTSTSLRTQEPESCASTNSATSAFEKNFIALFGQGCK